MVEVGVQEFVQAPLPSACGAVESHSWLDAASSACKQAATSCNQSHLSLKLCSQASQHLGLEAAERLTRTALRGGQGVGMFSQK